MADDLALASQAAEAVKEMGLPNSAMYNPQQKEIHPAIREDGPLPLFHGIAFEGLFTAFLAEVRAGARNRMPR